MDLVDIAEVSKIAHARGIRVVVDNAFASVALQRPLDHGADVVAYAATKLMDGSGRTLSGAVVGSADFINGVLHPYTRNTGNVPFNAWIVLKGLETLDLRAKAQAASALDLGAWLEARAPRAAPRPCQPPAARSGQKQMVAAGSVFSLELDGGRERR
jgi:cystathionine gamma-synthase/O-succinylhomoserine sulfhydrylase